MESAKGEWVLTSKGGAKFQEYPVDKINWTVNDQFIADGGRCTFYHVTTVDLDSMQIEVKAGNKEFGEGFYTLGSDTPEPYKIIGTDWFETGQKRFDWHVIAFSIKTDSLLVNLCNKQDDLKPDITFYLTHSTGYPRGGENPNAQDLLMIDNINRKTRVLVFPHTKQTKVAFGPKDETHSWDSFAAPKLGGGDYWLILGPQQPENMLQYRQYTWTTGWGIFTINAGLRAYAYRNYTHKPDGSRKSISGKWPSDHKVVIDSKYKTT
jgi:hypothetical protein